MKIMDCTLRDGANVVGNGFSPELTKMMIEGLLRSNIRIIEMGNAKGLGATEKGSPAPISDVAYLDLIHPYLGQAEIGMFLNAKRFEADNVAMAADKGISFLRLGADAGDGASTYEKAAVIKQHGIKVRYSLMKAYLLTPEELAEEAAGLEAHGVDEVTIMDSAGTMHPADAGAYVEALKARVKIPVGFHCHSNLGLSAANALSGAAAGMIAIRYWVKPYLLLWLLMLVWDAGTVWPALKVRGSEPTPPQPVYFAIPPRYRPRWAPAHRRPLPCRMTKYAG